MSGDEKPTDPAPALYPSTEPLTRSSLPGDRTTGELLIDHVVALEGGVDGLREEVREMRGLLTSNTNAVLELAQQIRRLAGAVDDLKTELGGHEARVKHLEQHHAGANGNGAD